MSSRESVHTPSWHWYLLGFIGLLRFCNLGFPDLQAWDEALYTVRAQAVVRFGAWLDQSSHAIDGLYSSLHPPLYVWLTAGAFHLFGETEWPARLISALAGAATLPVIALLGKRFWNPETGLIAALLFGLNPFVTFFTRQGQFDTLLVFFLTLSVYCFLKVSREPGRIATLLAGVSLGLALMTKLFVALLIPAALMLFMLRRGNRPGRPVMVQIAAALAIAGAISIPWHAFMAFSHAAGNPLFFFAQSALLQRTLYGIEGNVQPLEIFYYVNQLVVLFPAAAFFFFAGVREFYASKDLPTGILWSWFVVFFVIFSLMRTKLAVYTLPMFVPISVLAASVLWNHVSGPFRPRSWLILLTGTSFFLIWSFSQDARTAVKDVFLSLFAIQVPEGDNILLMTILVGSALLAIVFTYWMTSREWFPDHRQHIVIALLALVGGFSLVDVVVEDSTRYRDGATEVGLFVESHRFQRIVVAGFERNPQLTYYLDGADIDWRSDMSVRRILPPPSRTAYASWLIEELGGEPSSTLLLIEKDKFIRYQTIDPQDFVPSDYRLVLNTRRYSAYVRSQEDFLAAYGHGTIR
ncbi:MAG: glycosyltransferase family 39 protein [Bacteroidota bacterium]